MKLKLHTTNILRPQESRKLMVEDFFKAQISIKYQILNLNSEALLKVVLVSIQIAKMIFWRKNNIPTTVINLIWIN
jgi:hypothetical protein